MNILVSQFSSVPIYEQIKNQIKNNIITDKLKEGQILPSIRSLAAALNVSVITTKRAYDDLEKDGYIKSIVGKGSFVLPKNTQEINKTTLQKMRMLINEIIDEAKLIMLNDEEIFEMFKNIMKEVKSNEL